MRERFGDWNLYHKFVATLAASMVVGVIIRALIVIDTGFEVTSSRTIPASAETIWRYVVTDDLRDNWQGELIDLVELNGLTGETDSSRLLFWKRDFKRWQSVERTRAIVPGRSISLYQESDRDKRWVDISLTVLSPCETQLTISEVIVPESYQDRFWFFGERSIHEARHAASLNSMEHWTAHDQKTKGLACLVEDEN